MTDKNEEGFWQRHTQAQGTQQCKTLLIWFEKGSGPAFMAVIWLFPGVGKAIIPHLKEDIQGYLLI